MDKKKVGLSIVLIVVSLGFISIAAKTYFLRHASSRQENKNKSADGRLTNSDQEQGQEPSPQTKVS